MRIALDAMGSDRAPAIEVEGAVGALLEREDLRVLLVGDEAVIRAELERFPDAPRERIEIVHASEVIGMRDSPAQAVRRKPDSSIVRGVRLQKEGRADAFVSAGSTGATMAASLLVLRLLPGVDRPPVAAALPARGGRFLLLDMGANVDLKPAHFVQFALLGSIYAQDLMGIESPRVGLLNIGEEAEKGSEQVVQAHRLLREAEGIRFIGNVEGRDIIDGRCDVLVCDGFVGNVLLKFYETVAAFMAELLRREMEEQRCWLDLAPMYRELDYTEWGGAPLLGVQGVTFICHGGSPPRAIRNALLAAASAVERGLVDHIARSLAGTGGGVTEA
jgi:phosphate acyltransferase